MNNYEYIIASLPLPGKDGRGIDADTLTEEIRNQCSAADNELIDMLLRGFDADKLDYAFYSGAMHCTNNFIKEYFRYDFLVRNTKVEYLNKALGRPESQDLMPDPYSEAFGQTADPESPAFDDRPLVSEVLAQDDILARERGLDSLMWDKADELCNLHNFDLDLILAFIAKIKIAGRWTKLDPQTGREMFRQLVDEIRKTR